MCNVMCVIVFLRLLTNRQIMGSIVVITQTHWHYLGILKLGEMHVKVTFTFQKSVRNLLDYIVAHLLLTIIIHFRLHKNTSVLPI